MFLLVMELRKTEHKTIKLIVAISFLSICVLYLFVDYDSTKDNYFHNDNIYISKILLPAKDEKVATVNEATNSSHSSHIQVNDSKILPKNNTGKNVFVELRHINKSTNNIFFIESRCATEKMSVHSKGNKGLVLNARQCCAIESTARMNPDHNLYLFHSCSLEDDFVKHSPKFVEKLLTYPNIRVVRMNTTEVMLDSPIEELSKRKLLEASQYPVEHASDLIRLTLLWKFGGTYCDLDVVTIRPLKTLGTNWAGMQDEETIANGVINFEPEGSGHDMLRTALEYVNTHYDPSNWSTNGPLLITPIILRECAAQTVAQAQNHCNSSFTVLNNTVLYPIYYPAAGQLFDTNLGEQILLTLKNTSYSVHIWNKMSHDLVVNVGSPQAYALLAEEYCPEVYKNCGPFF